MEKCVHATQVIRVTVNDEKVQFLALKPVLDSVLTRYINTPPEKRVTMLGHGQVERFIEQDKAVDSKGDNDYVVSRIFSGDQNGISKGDARKAVSKAAGGADLSDIPVIEGVPGEGKKECISVGSAICFAHTVRRGYTTFYVKEDGRVLKYAVANIKNGSKNELIVTDGQTGEFLGIVDDPDTYGRHVENAEKIAIDEDLDVTLRTLTIAEQTTYAPTETPEDADFEQTDRDPAEVVGSDLAIAAKTGGYNHVAQSSGTEEVDPEGVAALVGARDKGYLKRGGSVMMPQLDDEVSVVKLQSLFD